MSGPHSAGMGMAAEVKGWRRGSPSIRASRCKEFHGWTGKTEYGYKRRGGEGGRTVGGGVRGKESSGRAFPNPRLSYIETKIFLFRS